MRYAYYPGCSLHSTASGYDKSVKTVCKNLDIDLWEIPDWTCCGASSAHSHDHLLGVAIPAKTLVPAEQQGLDVVAPCAACWQRLAWVNHEVNKDAAFKEKVSQAIGTPIQGTSQVVSIIEAVTNAGLDKIAEQVKKPLKGLKIASYYGCYYVKPPKVAHIDDPERPHLLDDIMVALGAEAVEWPYKTECCGASLQFIDLDTTFRMTGKVLDMAVKSGADLIVTACPLCQMNLDMHQGHANKKTGAQLNIPVAYFTQMMGVAFGYSPKEVGMGKNYVPYQNALSKIG